MRLCQRLALAVLLLGHGVSDVMTLAADHDVARSLEETFQLDEDSGLVPGRDAVRSMVEGDVVTDEADEAAMIEFLDPATADEDYISLYARHGEAGLPESHWSQDIVLPEAAPVDDMLLRVPLDPSIPNSTHYWNRSWWDVQKHYGPELGYADRRRLVSERRRLEFSRTSQSNCITVGGGMVPKYEYCVGCDMLAAQHCLWDMRNNISGNVPHGCRLDFNTLKPQTECCAQYTLYNKKSTIHGRTSAINDALLCLRNIGCENTMYYMSLEKECKFYTCDTVYVNKMVTHRNRRDNREVEAKYWRGSMYSVDKSGELSSAEDGLLNGCLDDGSLQGAAKGKLKKYWKKLSGLRYDKKLWDEDVIAIARAGENKWENNDDEISMPDSFDREGLFIQKNVGKDPTGRFKGKTIYKGPTRGQYLFLNGREVTPWDMTDEDDSILDPENWDDDTVDELILLKARAYYLWKKLFLGLPTSVSQHFRTDNEDYSVFENSQGRFAQIPMMDSDSIVQRRPARCSGCQPSYRGAGCRTQGASLALIIATITSLVFGFRSLRRC